MFVQSDPLKDGWLYIAIVSTMRELSHVCALCLGTLLLPTPGVYYLGIIVVFFIDQTNSETPAIYPMRSPKYSALKSHGKG
jgi:hypothetical protein